jgi:hypothetical protein
MRCKNLPSSLAVFLFAIVLSDLPLLAAGGKAKHNLPLARLCSTNDEERIEAFRDALAARREAIKLLTNMVNEPIVDGEQFDHAAEGRCCAILLLGQMRAKQAIDSLIPCLVPRPGQIPAAQYSIRVFSFAAHSLAEIGEPSVGPLVERMLHEDDYELVRACFMALVKIRGIEEGKMLLAETMKKGNNSGNLVRVLKWVGDAQLDWKKAMNEKPPWELIEEQMAYTSRMGDLGLGHPGSNVVRKSVSYEDPVTLASNLSNRALSNQKRLDSARELLEAGAAYRDFETVLDSMIHNREENSEWRGMCVLVLAQVCARLHPAVELENRLLNMIEKADVPELANEGVVQLAYLHAAGKVNRMPEVLNAMSNAVFSSSADSRTKVIALSVIRDSGMRSMAFIPRRILKENHPSAVVLNAVIALGQLGDDSDLEVLSGMQKSSDVQISSSAAKAITHILSIKTSVPEK